MILAQLLFWLSTAFLFHSYLLYPVLLKLVTFRRKGNTRCYSMQELPGVTVIMAVYNEESVIEEKIRSIVDCGYPPDKLHVLIGSDHSTDRTNELVKQFMANDSRIELVEFGTRSGKTVIVNELAARVGDDIMILTDANVFFGPGALFELVRHFKNDRIALVDSNMMHKGLRKEGISNQERAYIRSEVSIKHDEGLLAGCMMGPFGGCYALRRKFFTPVPAHFLVDDFYINMRVLEQGGKCINELNARVYEDVSHVLKEEFRRKARIATGNFQNLFAFGHLLLRFDAVSFCFFSHKVLRWLGPLFLMAALVSNLLLTGSLFFRVTLGLQLAFYCAPLLDYLLRRVHIHWALLRFNTHLVTMNLALLTGMYRYFRGVETSIWQPTRRNQ